MGRVLGRIEHPGYSLTLMAATIFATTLFWYGFKAGLGEDSRYFM